MPPTSKVTDTRARIPSGVKRPAKKMTNEEAKLNFVNAGQLDKSSASLGTASSKGGIAANLISAVKYQNEEYAEVKDFLSSIKLEKYFDKMIDNGIEDLETIMELQDDHVEQMGVPLGHKLKIIKKIKDLRTEKGLAVP